jgi:hypothetical protein
LGNRAHNQQKRKRATKNDPSNHQSSENERTVSTARARS